MKFLVKKNSCMRSLSACSYNFHGTEVYINTVKVCEICTVSRGRENDCLSYMLFCQLRFICISIILFVVFFLVYLVQLQNLKKR